MVEDSSGPKEPCIRWRFRSPVGMGNFKGKRAARGEVLTSDSLP